MRKTNLRTLLGLFISLACLAYVLRELDFQQLWSLAQHVNPLYYVVVNALYALSMTMRTWRWQILMRPVQPCGFGPLFSANIIGFMANNILPARVGELVRAWTGARLACVPVSSSLATILVERMLDGPVLLTFFFGVLYFLEPGQTAGGLSVEYLHTAGVSLAVGYVATLAVMAAVVIWPGPMIDFLTHLTARFSQRLALKFRLLLVSFIQGLASLRKVRTMLALLCLSVMVRVPIFLMHYFFLPALDLPQTLFMAAMATLGHGLALTIPAAPGYIGTYQLGVYWALLLAGAPKKPALAYAVIFWAAQYFPLVIAGLVETWRHGLAISSLSQRGQELADQDDGQAGAQEQK